MLIAYHKEGDNFKAELEQWVQLKSARLKQRKIGAKDKGTIAT